MNQEQKEEKVARENALLEANELFRENLRLVKEERKGRGVVARKNLDAYSTILADQALSSGEYDLNDNVQRETCILNLLRQIKAHPFAFDVLHYEPQYLQNEPSKIDGVSDEMYNRLMAIYRTNTFSFALPGGREKREVFPLISFLNHSCAPNCHVISNMLRTKHDILEGDEITINYNEGWDDAFDTEKRRQLLKQNWNFDCACSKCSTSSS